MSSVAESHLEPQALVLAMPGFHCRTRRRSLTKHARIKFKRLRFLKADFDEFRVSWIQKDIPFSADGCRRHQKSHGLTLTYPFIAKGA
jgi:hypothetical protein